MSRYDELMALRSSRMTAAYTDRDALLYALSIGMGRDPYHPGEMPFVNEFAGQKVPPTFVTVLARGLLVAEHVEYAKVVHARQCIDMHAPMPAAGEVAWDAAVTDIQDKGPGRGAFITIQTELRAASGQALATLTSTVMARGDGGLGGPDKPVPPRPADMPT
ncbi:MAG: MaoC family dehydratase N-terminal domain-containing protein, partial [Desulfobacterales bacterium]|nr:MaoC family dehydratase N-terminal domain-containing protein [Desulfobacterales bacterium]